MKQTLEAPVEYGDALLAPTTELAGLAELANARSQEERLATLVRVAHAIRDEDAARRDVRDRRAAAAAGLAVLPQRR